MNSQKFARVVAVLAIALPLILFLLVTLPAVGDSPTDNSFEMGLWSTEDGTMNFLPYWTRFIFPQDKPLILEADLSDPSRVTFRVIPYDIEPMVEWDDRLTFSVKDGKIFDIDASAWGQEGVETYGDPEDVIASLDVALENGIVGLSDNLRSYQRAYIH